MIKKIISSLSILGILFGTIGTPLVANAAQMTGVKDTLSTVTINQPATHVITATLAGANTFATGESITYDFADADFAPSAIGTWQPADFIFNDGTARTVVAVSATSGVPPTCTAGVNNVAVTITLATNTFAVVACSTYTASGAAPTTTFTINGTTAAGTGTFTNKATDVESSVYTIVESGADSATGAVVAETNGTVNITATVSPTLTFSNDDNAIGFGTLTSGAGRWANGAATGSASTVTAHTMAIGTNATTGYTLTYNGPTLTSGANTIAAATISADADGVPGSAQFALGATVTGTGTVTATYSTSANDYKFVPSTVSQIASATGPVTSDSIAVRYLANIPASQPAGNYATNLDYVATGNF
ncbi:MAG: hypothetical protein KBC11_03260 [Candidatus Pacebacteria bacterium]|nr:hypothetical protein [Candidatus Paceibacterota bacterium]